VGVMPSNAVGYTSAECVKNTRRIMKKGFKDVSMDVPLRLSVRTSEQDPYLLVILGKAISTAYLVEVDEYPTESAKARLKTEARKILDSEPLRLLANVKCPHSSSEEDIKSFKDSLVSAFAMINAYVSTMRVTPLFKDFMRQFIAQFDSSLEDFVQDTAKSKKIRESMKAVWSVRERFTDYSFREIHITFQYCGYFANENDRTEEEIEKTQRDCLEKHSQRFAFTVFVNAAEKDTAVTVLPKKAKELSFEMYQYFKLLVRRANREII
jgi:hypothetical protein